MGSVKDRESAWKATSEHNFNAYQRLRGKYIILQKQAEQKSQKIKWQRRQHRESIRFLGSFLHREESWRQVLISNSQVLFSVPLALFRPLGCRLQQLNSPCDLIEPPTDGEPSAVVEEVAEDASHGREHSVARFTGNLSEYNGPTEPLWKSTQ